MALLHITDKASALVSAHKKLAQKTELASSKYHITCEFKVRQGSIYKDIQAEADENEYMLLVIGTHGVRGLKQKLLGSDILKVITRISTPVMVVQSTSPLNSNFDRIIMPVATHLAYEHILDAVVMIAKMFGSEVHIYSIERPGFEWPEPLKKNLEKTRSLFEEHGIPYKRVNEKQTVLSVGFAQQTLQYAQKAGADLIAIMSVSSEEYHYFAHQDKENLLTNQGGIPVLCASNLSKED